MSRGTVSVVNHLGAGVLENPALHTVLHAVSRHLLDEDLLLDSVETYWAGTDLDRAKILADVAYLQISNFRTGEEISGPGLTSAARDELIARIEAEAEPLMTMPAEAF